MKILVIAVLTFGVLCQTRHIHPHNIDPDQIVMDEFNNGETDISIDLIRNMKPTRFVPLNNILFFKSFESCDDGFQRDALGICREVWD